MFVLVESERLIHVRFEGAGCTISQAAADLVAELAEGQSVSSVKALELDAVMQRIGLDVIRTRRDCASLALRTLQRALE
jgi:nitrogen fixation NifU-like protein